MSKATKKAKQDARVKRRRRHPGHSRTPNARRNPAFGMFDSPAEIGIEQAILHALRITGTTKYIREIIIEQDAPLQSLDPPSA